MNKAKVTPTRSVCKPRLSALVCVCVSACMSMCVYVCAYVCVCVSRGGQTAITISTMDRPFLEPDEVTEEPSPSLLRTVMPGMEREPMLSRNKRSRSAVTAAIVSEESEGGQRNQGRGHA